MPIMDRIFNMYSEIFWYVGKWFSDLLVATGATGIVLGMITLALVVRFLVAPLVGVAYQTAVSDEVRKIREKSRYHGKHERNYSGKYSK